MKRALILSIILITLVFAGMAGAAASPGDGAIKASYMKLPLSFIKNEGQKDGRVLFYEQGGGHATAFTKEGVSLSLGRSSELVTLTPLGASPFTIEAVDKKEGKVNYFMGNDPEKWKSNIPTYGAILYKNLSPGIDMKFYGTNSQLEYDIIVSPQGDPSRVLLSYKGIEKLSLTPSGELEVVLGEGSIYQKKPHLYQVIDGKRVEVKGWFTLADASSYGFVVGAYDRNHLLVIDPVLIYSTYLGGTFEDVGSAIAVDSSGCAYVTGSTQSSNFPTSNSLKVSNWGRDAFVTKLSASGDSLVYSTFLGGSDTDAASGIAVDSSGCAYVTGSTFSSDFPTKNPYKGTKAGAGNLDAFVTKLSASGDSLVYSTFLGGSADDYGYAIAVDSSGYAYVTGHAYSSNFPTSSDAFQSTKAGYRDAFVTKLNPSLSGSGSLIYSTYLGGSDGDTGNGIAVDSSGCAYVTGFTSSSDFPVSNAFQKDNTGDYAAFVTKVSASGGSLVYSTYLGGNSSSYGYAIAVDSSGCAYVTGFTSSSDFPVRHAFQEDNAGSGDAFVTKVSASGNSLVYSTHLGGSGSDSGYAIAVDSSGCAYVTGTTYSGDFPTSNAFQKDYAGSGDAFVTKFSASGNNLVSSTYLGGTSYDYVYGIAVDSSAYAYVTGATSSNPFPTKNPYQGTNKGSFDAFVAKLINNILTVSKTGTGSGTVMSSPGHIDCGDTCIDGFGEGIAVTLTATAATGSAFTGWSGACSGTGTCIITMTADTSLSAAFVSPTVTASVSGGHGTVSPATQKVVYGSSATITMTPDDGYHIATITDIGTSATGSARVSSASGARNAALSGAAASNSYVIVNVTADHAVTVTYGIDSEALTATITGTGSGTISATGLTCSGSSCSGSYDYGTSVAITAQPGTGSTFTGWTGCDSTSGSSSVSKTSKSKKAARSKAAKAALVKTASSDTTCTVTMMGARSVSADFALAEALTATITGTGSGTISATGLTCSGSSCAGTYNYGTSVVITAQPSTGSSLSGWTGCDSTSGNTCTVAMTSAKSVSAAFTLGVYGLAASWTGNGTLSGTDLTCSGSSCSGSFTYGAPVMITATPDRGSRLSSFTGCNSISGNTCTVAVTSAKNITASFADNNPCTFTLASQEESFTHHQGSVTVNVKAEGINCMSPNVSSGDTWITLSTSFMNNKGKVKIHVSKNSAGTERSGTVFIEENAFTVTQKGAPCALAISPDTDTFTAAGGSDSFQVSATEGCSWTAQVEQDAGTWLSALATTGSGNGAVTYWASQNSTGAKRSGKITVSLTGTPHKTKVFTVTEKKAEKK